MITQPGIALMLLVKCPYGDSQEGHQVKGRRCQNLAEHLSFYMKWMVQSWNSVKGSSQSQISRFWTVLQVPRPLQWLSSLHSNTVKMDYMYVYYLIQLLQQFYLYNPILHPTLDYNHIPHYCRCLCYCNLYHLNSKILQK